MIHHSAETARELKTVPLSADFIVIGGGLSGICASIAAARQGTRVVLVTDRPVLGGNASSEIRLWILGATSHMGNNNRWAREGGVVDEILVENLYRNPEGNPVILDCLLLEMVARETNIQLLLNSSVYQVDKSDESNITAVTAFCSQNSTRYQLRAPLFCDASGDGIVAYLAGAAFRVGAESCDEFDEGMAPSESLGELLGHSLYFYSKDTGKPVSFVPPAFAMQDIAGIPRYRDIRASDSGCRFWWLEWGGRLDTVHETESIKWQLWRVAYGVWNYIKNSGNFPDAANLTLEWMGAIPGKRESRRFQGEVMLTQRDIVEQRQHSDAVSFGGWAIDLHPADGVFSKDAPCTQWHAKGIYQIPFRALYSRNIGNLFLAGRIISASHVAFGSTRVMATCGNSAQAVGVAAGLCRESSLQPRDLLQQERVAELQQRLLRMGAYVPGVPVNDDLDLARRAVPTATSWFLLNQLEPDGATMALDASRAMMIPVAAGPLPAVQFLVDVHQQAELKMEVRSSARQANFTPDLLLHHETRVLHPGVGQMLSLQPEARVDECQYVFYCLAAHPDISVHTSALRVTGVLSLSQSRNAAVAKSAKQEPPAGSGVDSFEFWFPSRRPEGRNLAVTVTPAIDLFRPANVTNGTARPTMQPNAWVADSRDPSPCLTLRWNSRQSIGRIELSFDTDFDHPMESVLMGHPEREMPFCVKSYRVRDGDGRTLAERAENHQTRNVLTLSPPVETAELHIDVLETHGAPAAIFEVRCYGRVRNIA